MSLPPLPLPHSCRCFGCYSEPNYCNDCTSFAGSMLFCCREGVLSIPKSLPREPLLAQRISSVGAITSYHWIISYRFGMILLRKGKEQQINNDPLFFSWSRRVQDTHQCILRGPFYQSVQSKSSTLLQLPPAFSPKGILNSLLVTCSSPLD